MLEVAVIETKVANIASMIAALTRLNVKPVLTTSPKVVAHAPFVVLPGVGAFEAGMSRLHELELVDALRARVASFHPTFCVCLGLQLLCNASEESPEVPGLGILDAHAIRFDGDIRIPQLGWNLVEPQENTHYLRTGYAYFANSYHLNTLPQGWRGAYTHYGQRFVSAVEREGVLAAQFHPELSGAWGHDLIQRWLMQGG